MIYRVRFKVAGGHVHCALFSALALNQTFAKCGDFVVARGTEFKALMRDLSGVQFVGEGEDGVIVASSEE